MISRLRGQVIEVSAGRLVVLCGGVGYEVSVPESVVVEFGVMEAEIELWTRQVIREDEHNLYGFANGDQRRLFDLLRDVKGCGSKTSLNLIGSLGEGGVVEAIAAQDLKGLARAPGVGPRLAERIVVELKDKVLELRLEGAVNRAVVASRPRPSAMDDELMEALLSLGYRRSEAEEAAHHARSEADGVEDQIKAALKRLAR